MLSNKSIKQDKQKEPLMMSLALIHSAIVKTDEMETIAVVKVLYSVMKKNILSEHFL